VNCNNWSVSLASPIYWREESIRSDYNLSKTWKLMGRFTQDHWNQPSPSTLGYWGDDNYPSVDPNWVQPGYQGSIRLTKLIGDSAVNDFQIAYTANRITVTRGGDNPASCPKLTRPTRPFPTLRQILGEPKGLSYFLGRPRQRRR